ncbi:MAG: hypothetical protein J1G04_04905 [Clostridiales bacterium]|nr:hypothetical protein [Clostridiales bacterium]
MILVLTIAFAAVVLSACGASLTFYDYYEDGVRVNEYVLEIDRATVDRMEESAISDDEGERYTVQVYFRELFVSYGYELIAASSTDDGYAARYRKSFYNGVTPELYEITGAMLNYESEIKRNPFTAKVKRTADNPFNGVRAAYDGVTDPDVSGRLIEQLKNGRVAFDEYNERKVLFPAVQDAFPYLQGIDPDRLLLSFAVDGSARMKSTGTATKLTRDYSRYVFSRYFDTTERKVEFEYTRPVAYGWYIVALLAGGAVVGIFVLATRQKKQKTTLLDRFPYNPEEYRDYDSHLPIGKK